MKTANAGRATVGPLAGSRTRGPLLAARGGPASKGFATGTFVFLILAFGFPLQVAYQSATLVFDPATLLQLAIVVYSSLHLAKLVLQGRPYLVEFFFRLYVYIWLGLAPFAQLATGRTPVWSGFSRTVALQASAVILIGLVGYDFGQSWASRTSKRGLITNYLSNRHFSWGRLRILTIGILFTAPFIVQMLGGPRTMFVSRQTTFSALTAVGASDSLVEYNLLKAALTVPSLLAILTAIHLRRERAPGGPSRGGFILLMAFLIVVNVITNNPIANPRYWAGTALGGTLLVWRPLRSRPWTRFGAIAVLFVLVFAFPYADYFRYEDERYRDELKTSTEQMVSNLDYDSYPQIQNAIQHVRERGHTIGKQMSGAATFWVPRRWWADKPIPTGELMAEARGWPYTNLSAPIWAETYIDFGFFALLPIFFGLGLVSRRLDRAYDRSLHGAGGLLQVLVPVLAVYQLILLRGSLLPIMGPLVAFIGLALLMTTSRRHDSLPS